MSKTLSNRFSKVDPLLPAVLLHLEGLALFVSTTLIYAWQDLSWVVFALLFFVPDVSILAYTLGASAGSRVYNLVHSTVLPLLLGLTSLQVSWQTGQIIALIWLAHIGFDRLLGYGLKYATHFKDTHLDRVA